MVNSSTHNGGSGTLSPRSLNHISLVCRSIKESIRFYQHILCFLPIKSLGSFGFDGTWMFNYGIGIHLLQSLDPYNLPRKTEINPIDNHISFLCEDVQAVERKLEEMKIKYMKRIMEEGGIYVDPIAIRLSSTTAKIFHWSQSWGLPPPAVLDFLRIRGLHS